MCSLRCFFYGAGRITFPTVEEHEWNAYDQYYQLTHFYGARAALFDIVGFYDSDASRSQTIQARHSIPSVSTLEGSSTLEFDLAVVATSTDSHFSTAMWILEHLDYIKALIIEKPITMSTHELIKLYAYAELRDVPIIANYNRRFSRYLSLSRYLDGDQILSIDGIYTRGHHHIGSTMLDLIYNILHPGLFDLSDIKASLIQRSGQYQQSRVLLNGLLFPITLLDLGHSAHNKEIAHVFDVHIYTNSSKISIIDNSSKILVANAFCNSEMKPLISTKNQKVISTDFFDTFNLLYRYAQSVIYGRHHYSYEQSLRRDLWIQQILDGLQWIDSQSNP